MIHHRAPRTSARRALAALALLLSLALAACGSDQASSTPAGQHDGQVAGGAERMCYFDDGLVSCWGRWWDGDADEVVLTTPTQVRLDKPVTSMAISTSHNFALFEDGSVARFHLDGTTTPLPGVEIDDEPDRLVASDTLLCLEGAGWASCWTLLEDAQLGELVSTSYAYGATTVSVSRDVVCEGTRCSRPGADSDAQDVLEWVTGSPDADREELRHIAVSASGSPHACARSDIGEVWCWGTNTWGQLGLTDTEHRTSYDAEWVPVPLVKDIVAGSHFTCASTAEDGDVWCWGNWRDGIGEETELEPVRLRGLTGATALAAGWDTACAVAEGDVLCWGTVPQEDGSGFTGSTQPVTVLRP